jgi:hypothetical protein
MALQNIPIIWSAQTLVALRAATVYGAPAVTNRNHQGEITDSGDRVRVTGLSDPTVFDSPAGLPIPDPEALSDNGDELVIDQSKGVNFQVDDLDQLQNVTKGLLLKSAANAAIRWSEVADAHIAAKIVAGVHASNKIGTVGTPVDVDAPEPGVALAVGATSVYRLLVRLGIKLDKVNVPKQGRWVVLPAFMMGALSIDPRFTAAADAPGQTLRNGFTGQCAGFSVYTTSAVPQPAASKYSVVAGSPLATSYAEQLVQMETYRHPNFFGDAIKGRHVYGSKVFYPKALALATVQDVSDLDD